MGTITQALRTAQSGLLVNQRIMDTIGQNVSNVNTEGYSRKIVTLENQSLAGTGAGVNISEIIRRVDEGLLRSVRIESGELNELSVQEDYWARLQDLFGAPGENTSIAHVIDEFTQAAETLTNTPEGTLEKTEFVRQAENVTLMLRELSDSIQELRLQADQDLATVASRMNTLVNEIDQLNDDIISNGSVSRDTTDLRDQRDGKLTELSELVDIRYFFRTDGDVVVFTSGGTTLVDTVPPSISHTAASAVSATTTQGEGDFSGFFIGDSSSTTNERTSSFRDGQVKGLIDLRDSFLPDLQSQIDQLAANLRDTMNQVHNRGMAFPGQQSFSGTRTFVAPSTQAIQLDTTNSVDDVTFALFDTSGNETARTTLNTIMVDAGFASRGQTTTTADMWHIDDVAATIQGWLRNNGATTATAAVSSSGQFDIALNNTSVNLAIRDETATADGSTQSDASISYNANSDVDNVIDETVSGFSNFFGLNDLFVDNLSDNIWESDIQNTSFTASAATLTFRDSSGTIGSTTLTITAGQSLSEIAAAINANTALNTKLSAGVVSDGSGQRLRISHATGSDFQITQASGNTFLSDIGLDIADVRTSTALSVRSDILTDPGNLATGAPQWNASLGSSGQYFMSTADDAIVTSLASALTTNQTFSVTGGLPSVSATFSQRAAAIVATNASFANDNARDLEAQKALTESLVFKQQSESGVNLDEEMANLIIFEQAFSAAARVITVINEMFDALERIV